MIAKVPNIKFIPNRIVISFQTDVSCINRKALAAIFTKVIIIGITIGKLKIAIKVALLLALEAIDETKVNANENPMLPNKIATENKL